MLDFLPYMIVGAGAVLTSSPIFFLVCLGLNELVNKTLKNAIRQPRPTNCATYLKKSYGMPSGHSQVAGFASAFVWWDATQMQQIALALATLATLVQRVVSHCHSVPQVLSGFAVGAVFGLLCYKFALTMKQQNYKVM